FETALLTLGQRGSTDHGDPRWVVNARKWDAVLLTDVTFHRDGTHDLWVDGHKWKLVVEGKVAIAMGEAMGQRWEAGGARSFKSRPGQGRVLGLHFPRQGRRKGLMLIVCYAPISSARRTDRQEFLRQVTEVKARTPGGDWLIVGGDFNAEIGANQAQHYPTVMGQFGSGSTSRTGPELLEWCQQEGLVIIDSRFQQPLAKKYTWWHPSNGTGHVLDHFLMPGSQVKYRVGEVTQESRFGDRAE
ncbi:unnamed protein product, partial [Effrenium voratum]